MAPKKNQKKGGKAKTTSSSAKVANKNLNKFAKTGKLRKQRLKQQQKERKNSKRESKDQALTNGDTGKHSEKNVIQENGIQDPEEDLLQEEDIEFYTGQNAAFAQRHAKKNRKRHHGEEEDEEDAVRHEKTARTQFAGDAGQKMKILLPIKDKGRVIPQMVEEEYEEEQDEEVFTNAKMMFMPDEDDGETSVAEPEGEGEDSQAAEPLPQLSGVELVAHRQRKIAKRKQRIAELATAVIENPEENINKLKELRKLLGEKDPDVCLTVRKLVMVSLCEIFTDIIPGYRIRLPTAQEKEQRMKQDTKKLMDYESALLLSYKTYLEYLEHTISGKSFEKNQRLKRLGFSDVSLPKQKKTDLVVLAVQCMSKLLTSQPHFNYRADVVTFLIPLMNHKLSKVSDTVCQAARDIFVADKGGQVILEIVRAMSKMMKSRKFHVQPKVLETLHSLKIKEINMDKAEVSRKMLRKEKFKKYSRRERKHMKQTELLDKELQETRATQDKEQRLKVHTQIVETMFTTFFNVLKQEDKSPLLPMVLALLSRFTHLISVDFFHDLYAVFNKLIESEELTQVETLRCVQTAFRILSGQGVALNIDPIKFYTHLYNAMLGVHACSFPDDAAGVVDCLDASIIRRKKQVTQQRVLAYTKRLTTLALTQLPEAAAAYLAVARCMVSMFPYTDVLFDGEVEGSGMYMAYLQEPEHCHASSAVLWELHALRRHYHPDVKRLATALLHKSTSDQGELSKKTPAEVYKHLRKKDTFPTTVPSKAKNKSKAASALSSFKSHDFEEELRCRFPPFFQ